MKATSHWNTSKKLPFWLRRVDVPVSGKAAAEQRTEFNWQLVTWPLYGALAIVIGLLAVWAGFALFGITVSLVKAFPVVAAVVILYFFFKR